jgi:hypothetical protein
MGNILKPKLAPNLKHCGPFASHTIHGKATAAHSDCKGPRILDQRRRFTEATALSQENSLL